MIGSNGGKEIGNTFTSNFAAGGIIRNTRSFHLMESDFWYSYFPKDGQLKVLECDCDDNLFDDLACGVDACNEYFVGQSGEGSKFQSWKEHYCSWKKTSGIFKMKEIYASLESINPKLDFLGSQDIPCSTTGLGRNYPDKWYLESEWGNSISEIQDNARKYAESFVATFCPKDENKSCVVDVLEVGNEPWGSSLSKNAYHAILRGIKDALVNEYQTSDINQWRMKLAPAAFEAYYNPVNTTPCLGEVNHYVNDMIPNDVKPFLSFASVHNYPGTYNATCQSQEQTVYTIRPESDNGGFLTLKNMKKWLEDPNNNMTHAKLNMTEFGWNSNTFTTSGQTYQGIGEVGQAAYVIRGILIGARYGIHKAFVYSYKDDLQEPLFGTMGLINSSGNKKKVLLSLEKLLNNIKDKQFLRKIEENNNTNNGVFAYVLGNTDGTPTHLVAWKPSDLNEGITSYPIPAPIGQETTITMESTDITINSNSSYFYLSWDNTQDKNINDGSSVVSVNTANPSQVQIRLSPIPIIIP